MQVRTVVVVAAAFVASVLAADQLALSLARLTDEQSVTTDRLQTTNLATPGQLEGTVRCTALLYRSNRLRWRAVPTAEGYLVERSIDGDTFVSLAASTTPGYSDTKVSAGTYRYRVSATRSSWTSPPSSPITLRQPTLCL